jgi:hypothetical protein
MANPDLKNLNNVYGIGEGIVNIPTTPTGILVNNDSSGFVYKINTIYVSNIHPTDDADLTIDLYNNSSSSIMAYFTKNMNVPHSQSVVPVSQHAPVYLNEARSIRATSSIPSGLSIVVSYEVIS